MEWHRLGSEETCICLPLGLELVTQETLEPIKPSPALVPRGTPGSWWNEDLLIPGDNVSCQGTEEWGVVPPALRGLY